MEAGAPDLPDGLERGRNMEDEPRPVRVWGPRAGLLLIAALPVVALFNVFGQRASTSTAATPVATLSVHAPTRVRGGLIYQIRFVVTAHRKIKNVELLLSPGWFDGLSVNAVEPSPSQEDSKNGRLSFAWNAVDPGKRFIAFMYFQVNPTTVGHRDVDADLYDGGTLLAHVHRTLTVFP